MRSFSLTFFLLIFFQFISYGQFPAVLNNDKSVPIDLLKISRLKNKWGLLDFKKDTVLQFYYDSVKYNGNYRFSIFKNGKIGYVEQLKNCDTLEKYCESKIFFVDAIYDSLILKEFFIYAYLNNQLAVFYDDGSLLFPLSLNKKVCDIMFIRSSNLKGYLAKQANKNEIIIKRKKKNYAKYNEPILYYNKKFYRLILPIFSRKINGVLLTKTIVDEVILTKYFRKIMRRNSLLNCND